MGVDITREKEERHMPNKSQMESIHQKNYFDQQYKQTFIFRVKEFLMASVKLRTQRRDTESKEM